MQTEKAQIRSLLLQQRRNFSTQEVNEKSQRTLMRLQSFPVFLHAQTVILYSAEADEVQTEAIWQESLRLGKKVYYPRISADRADLEFVRRLPDVPLVAGTFNIPIPPGNDLLHELQTTDIVFTPGVGFDKAGHRLGRGKGYYDRAFRDVLVNAVRVALAFEFQILPRIPVSITDVSVHYLVTEMDVYPCCPSEG